MEEGLGIMSLPLEEVLSKSMTSYAVITTASLHSCPLCANESFWHGGTGQGWSHQVTF